VKHALSNISSPLISDAEDGLAVDNQTSINTSESPEVIEVESDDKLDDLEKKLSPLSAFYSFLVISLISIHRSGQANLEVPDILILQT
jgi:hypothetical protein